MNEDEILKEEDQEMVKRIRESGDIVPDKYTRVRVLAEVLEKALHQAAAPEIEFPENQKVHGEVTVKSPIEIKEFPKVQKVKGLVEAIVKFPLVQKITGTVKALVEFPEVQKVSGHVKADVEFPETQKIVGQVDAVVDLSTVVSAVKDLINKLPVGKGEIPSTEEANPRRYIPVRLTNGKFFYDVMSQTVQSNGKLVAAVKELTGTMNAGWESVAYTALTNSLQTLPANARKFGGYFIGNPNNAEVYVQVFFDKAAILGTTDPDAVYRIPANASANMELSRGRRVTTSIQVAATTTSTGSSAPSTALSSTFYYL